MTDTIFAISSGAPPAAIGIIRISGPLAGSVLEHLSGRDFEPRRASLTTLKNSRGLPLDSALVLWFPGPETATGEDLAELHCHGGRAVLSAVCAALAALPGLRAAEAGEFTRRAFANGRIDLAEAEGLGDLLSAETELQRAAAMQMAGGIFSAQVDEWRSEVLRLSAQVEAALDFSDEDDVSELPPQFAQGLNALSTQLEDWCSRPRVEKLGEGFRVVLAGPPNSGKSTLFNALIESEAAITSDIAGTTRDVIERNVAIESIPFSFVDTAGLHDGSGDQIERIGIERAQVELARADLVLWLGPEGQGPEGQGPDDAWEIAARADADDFTPKSKAQFTVSASTGAGVQELKLALVEKARDAMPRPGEAALNARQHTLLSDALDALLGAQEVSDPLLCGEELRRARAAFDRLIGKATTEDMLDALVGRFCIGK